MAYKNKPLWRKVQQGLIDLGYPLPRWGADGMPGDETGEVMLKLLNGLKECGASEKEDEPELPVETNDDAKTDPVPVPARLDDRTERNIATLVPKLQGEFRRLAAKGKEIAKSHGAGDYKIISGTRSYAEQNALYAKGRTTGGRRVTNARGGYSNHNFGIAVDFGVFGPGGKYWDSERPNTASKVHRELAAWAKENMPEIEWGGDWTSFKDYPHFQWNTGKSLSQMRSDVANNRPIV